MLRSEPVTSKWNQDLWNGPVCFLLVHIELSARGGKRIVPDEFVLELWIICLGFLDFGLVTSFGDKQSRIRQRIIAVSLKILTCTVHIFAHSSY